MIFDGDEGPGRAGGNGEERSEGARGRSENLRRAEQRCRGVADGVLSWMVSVVMTGGLYQGTYENVAIV